MGYHTAGKGIVVHRMECPNVAELPQVAGALGGDRLGPRGRPATSTSAMRIEVENRPGVLAQVAAAIAKADSNIDRVEYLERDSNIAVLRFAIEVTRPQATWPT